MSSLKQYVLLDHMLPSANNVFVRISKGQRSPLKKTTGYRPYMRVSYTDPTTKKVVNIRYKYNSDSIVLDEQMKNGIPANEKFVQQEYRALEFKSNVLSTDNPTLQAYLEAYPGFEGNQHLSTDVPRKEYLLYDKATETKNFNALTKKRIEAGARVFQMKNQDAVDLLYKIYGALYQPSEEIEDNREALINYLDGSDEAVEVILSKELTVDDEAAILIGKLINAGVISFDVNPGFVAKKIDKDWKNVKAISSEFAPEERIRLFGEFLLSEEGKPYWTDFENNITALEKAAEKQKEKNK